MNFASVCCEAQNRFVKIMLNMTFHH